LDSIQTLKRYWGFSDFRPLQKEIVESVAAGKDVLALLPTGGGKSICFQVPGMMREGIVIVISPLIALMKDQVENLRKKDIKAEAIVSGMTTREIDIILDNCIYGQIKFLYVSPERLKTEIFLERLKKMNVAFFAVDEAHCISQWGFDFRPSYLEIAELRQLKPKAHIIALTATATPEVRQDIVKHLQLKNPEIFVKSFSRANLSYSVRKAEDKNVKMLEIVRKVKGSAIVYASTRRRTRDLAEFLNKNGIKADYYNAGLSMKERINRQEAWLKDRKRIIVATNAFGMGIDKPSVRLVIHMDIPATIEAYYQEAGRAGRDERKAYAVIVYHSKDKKDLIERVEKSKPTLKQIRRTYQALANYLKIAVGSISDQLYPFDLKEFCKGFKLDPFEVASSIKVLENEGILVTSDGYKNPSRILITADPKILYKKQVSDEMSDKVIKSILRVYGGDVFNNYQNIDEGSISKISGMEEKEILNKLTYLKKQGFIDYIQGNNKPALGFSTYRMEPAKLEISNEHLLKRAKLEKEKAASMVAYVENTIRCRTLQLLEYFGEVTYLPCGVCDVCVARKNEKLTVDPKDILTKVTSHPVALQDIIAQWPASKREDVLDQVRALIEKGDLMLQGANMILRVDRS